MSTYAFESADCLISCFVRDGVWTLAMIDPGTKRFEIVPIEFTDISQLRAAPGRVVFIGGSPSEPPGLIDLDLGSRKKRVVRRASVLRDDVRRYISVPERIAFPTGGGETADGDYLAHATHPLPYRPERRRTEPRLQVGASFPPLLGTASI